MNKVYRSVWSASRQCFVVAAETVRAKGKPSSSSVAALASVSMVALLGWSQPAAACPTTVSGNESACTLGAGQSVTIESTGEIVGTGVTPAISVGPSDPTSVAAGTIDNQGTLESGFRTILLDRNKSLVELNNSGTIRTTASGAGVYVFGGSSITTLTNSGLIEATNSNGTGVALDGSTIGTFVNTGTITAYGSNFYGIQAGNSSSVNVLRNSGTIGGRFGAILDPNGAIREIEILGNDTARFIGLSQAPFYFTVDAPQTKMIVTPSATYTLLTTDNFRVSNFENRGVLQLESGALGQSAAIIGDYTQTADGVLRIQVTDDTTYGQLSVKNGDVTLPSNAKFDVKVDNTDFSFTSSALTGVVSVTNGTINWDETFEITDNSVLFDFEPTLNGNSIDLKILASNGNGISNNPDLGATSNAVIATGNRVARGAAVEIDEFARIFASSGTTGNADLNDFLVSLGALTTDSQLANAVESTLPVMQGAAPRINLGTQVNMAQSIQSRQQGTLGLAAGDAFVDRHLWVKPFGSWGDQKNRNGAQGYDSKTYGVVVGVDAEISPNYRIGASFGYANSSADSNNGLNSIDVDSYLISVYGTANLSDNTSMNWQAGYSYHDNEGSRTIPLVSSVAKSDYSSQGWQLGVGLDHSIELSETVTFIPGVRLDYDRIKDKAYTETGAGGLNLDVNSNSTEQLVLGLNSRFQFDVSETSTINADIGVGHDFNAKQNSITAAYSGGGAAFTTQGIKPSKTLWNAGLGYVNQAANGTEITARADVQQRTSGQQDASASLTFRWKF